MFVACVILFIVQSSSPSPLSLFLRVLCSLLSVWSSSIVSTLYADIFTLSHPSPSSFSLLLPFSAFIVSFSSLLHICITKNLFRVFPSPLHVVKSHSNMYLSQGIVSHISSIQQCRIRYYRWFGWMVIASLIIRDASSAPGLEFLYFSILVYQN